jgi:hypothetical protein
MEDSSFGSEFEAHRLPGRESAVSAATLISVTDLNLFLKNRRNRMHA